MEQISATRIRRRQSGQGMTEYIIIVALVAVAAIGVYQFLGQSIRSQTAGITNEIAGKSAQQSISEAGTAAAGADSERQAKSLSTYSTKNTGGGAATGTP